MDLNIIGYIATTISGISLVPEVTKALKTHHLRDLAWGMLILMFCGSILWIIYGFYIQSYPLIISATLNLSMEITLITLKVIFTHKINWAASLKPKDIEIEGENE